MCCENNKSLKKYIVEITEEFSNEVLVEARSHEEAIMKVQEAYEEGLLLVVDDGNGHTNYNTIVIGENPEPETIRGIDVIIKEDGSVVSNELK